MKPAPGGGRSSRKATPVLPEPLLLGADTGRLAGGGVLSGGAAAWPGPSRHLFASAHALLQLLQAARVFSCGKVFTALRLEQDGCRQRRNQKRYTRQAAHSTSWGQGKTLAMLGSLVRA